MKQDNAYLTEIEIVLPRLLALYDRDPTSATWGVGDRFYWAWKLIDFGNGTFQGAAHGLARLLAAGLLPGWITEQAVLRRIDAMFAGAQALTRANGSLEEAFPYESSFCVTALVAYDLLSAIDLLGDRLTPADRERYIGIIRPMRRFLGYADETHGLISNHLATGVAALLKWNVVTGQTDDTRARHLLDRILQAASAEGWFREYQGADPGYQSLCTYYLADVARMRPDWSLQDTLATSIRFLWHFAHPDGSFGGYYGSRNTRFFYPAGVEALAAGVPEAAALAHAMRESIAQRQTVTLSTMDEPNLIPMFNAYCWAAAEMAARGVSTLPPVLPARTGVRQRIRFEQAGLLVDAGPSHYTIVSLHKGGACYHFVNGRRARIDAGVLARARNGKWYSSQSYQLAPVCSVDGDRVTVTAPLVRVNRQLPGPLQFAVLRVLTLTLMRSLVLGNLIKQMLVKMLITGARPSGASNRRTIVLGPDMTISDALEGDRQGLERVDQPEFSAIHMASQGYWQLSDEQE